MTVLVILVAVLALVTLGLLWRRHRAAGRERTSREAEIRASLTDARPSMTSDESVGADPVTVNRSSADPWSDIAGLDDPAGDPAAPPAAIHLATSGTHPWAPARIFLTDLKSEGYDTTVELPDLVVMRDDDRRPVTVRETSGRPGHLVVTAPPEAMARTLELLVRSLLDTDFTIDATDGRDVHLVDDDGATVRLTVTDLALT